MILTLYDPTVDKYVDITLSNVLCGVEVYDIAWIESPIHYTPESLLHFIESLPIGKLRAIHDTMILTAEGELTVAHNEPIEYDFFTYMNLIEWVLDEAEKKNTQFSDAYLNNIRDFE